MHVVRALGWVFVRTSVHARALNLRLACARAFVCLCMLVFLCACVLQLGLAPPCVTLSRASWHRPVRPVEGLHHPRTHVLQLGLPPPSRRPYVLARPCLHKHTHTITEAGSRLRWTLEWKAGFSAVSARLVANDPGHAGTCSETERPRGVYALVLVRHAVSLTHRDTRETEGP